MDMVRANQKKVPGFKDVLTGLMDVDPFPLCYKSELCIGVIMHGNDLVRRFQMNSSYIYLKLWVCKLLGR